MKFITHSPLSRLLRTTLVGAAVAVAAVSVSAQTEQGEEGGYFSGIRFTGQSKPWSFSGPGLKLGQSLEYARGLDSNTAYSGYRFENGLSLGAAINTEPLQPYIAPGVGLKLDGFHWGQQRNTVNLDVVSAFNWRSSLSVFGKIGMGRADGRYAPEWASSAQNAADKTSLSYGLGVRYDVSPNLGLKLEYTRGTRFGVDSPTVSPETDSVNLGLRWSF